MKTREVEEGSVSTTSQPQTMASIAIEQPHCHNNVTFKPKSGSCAAKTSLVVATEDLIPPYDALKIDALNNDQDNEEGDSADADMEDAISGNELMVIEDDD